MKVKYLVMLLAAMLMVFASCDNSSDKGGKKPPVHKKRHSKSILTPTSSGNPYEVMVVCSDSSFAGYVGQALKEVLNRPIPMLPQDEPSFHVSHVTERHYDRITKLFRNIVKIEVNKHYSEPRIKLERNVYSDPQLIMTIIGPTENEISTFITEKTNFIIKYFSAEEINRQATALEDSHNIKFNEKVYEMFDCELYIPIDLNKMKVGENFIWASDDGMSSIQNICIYSYPYVSQKVFNRGVYIALRDSFMGANIPGELEGSVMSTNRDFVTVENMQIQGHYVQEARGFWEMTKDVMGGPFVAHSQVDTINNRVIVVEGFVYAPDKMKRTMIRRLEAALYTLKLPGKDESEK